MIVMVVTIIIFIFGALLFFPSFSALSGDKAFDFVLFMIGVILMIFVIFGVAPKELNKGLPLEKFTKTQLTKVVLVSKEQNNVVFCEQAEHKPVPCYRVSVNSFVGSRNLQSITAEKLPAPGLVLYIEAIVLGGKEMILVVR